MEIKNKRLSDEEFFEERKGVLAEWPTGRGCDLEEAVAYHKSMPPSKNYALKLAEAKRKGKILLSAAEGADTVERHIALLQAAQDEGRADLLSTWIDAMTRNHRYAEAEQEVRKAESSGKPVLNGFPIVHYGVPGMRRVVEAVDLPVDIHPNGPDLRLIEEIALAGGVTCTVSGGSFSSFFGYTKDLPLETTLRNNQYYRRLEAYYEERGVPIHVVPGPVVSGLMPPSLAFSFSLIEALLGAEQGVKHLQLVSGGGNLIQCIAATTVANKVAREYLDKFGHKDVEITCTGGGHPGSGKWPADAAQAFAILSWHPIMAVLCKVPICTFFTIDEGHQIPRKEAVVATLRHNRMVLNLWKDQGIEVDKKAVRTEAEVEEREVRAMLDRVFELGDGDVVIGAVRAVEAGVLDVPFSANQRTQGKVLGIYDAQGAIRLLHHGNLPFSQDIIDFHKEKIAKRSKEEGREANYEAVIGDLFALSRGNMISSPDWQAEEPVKGLVTVDLVKD